LTINPGATKAELRKVFIEYFVEEDLMLEEEASGSTQDGGLELKQLELEHKARELEREQECQLKIRELEIREKEMNAKMEVELKEH